MRFLRSFTPRRLWSVFLISAVGTLAFAWAMLRVSQPLHPNTIIWLELAFTPSNAMAILKSWGDVGRAAALESLILDVGFILLGYAPLLASACLLIESRIGQWLRPVVELLALGALIAGGLDLVENAALWGVISHPLDPPALLTWTAGIAAAIKFLLVLAAGAFVLLAGPIRWLFRTTPLVQWVLSAPLLALIAALVLAILWRVALAALGIPDLFWTESAILQTMAGIGVGPLLTHLGVLGFLLDSQRVSKLGAKPRAEWLERIRVLPRSEQAQPGEDTPLLLASYLVRSSLPLVVVAMASALRAPGGVSPWWLPLGTFAGFLGCSGLWIGLSHLPVPMPAPEAVRKLAKTASFENLHRLAYAFLILNGIIYSILAVLYHAFGFGVSVGLTLCVLLGLLASIYAGWKYFFPDYVNAGLAAAVVAYVTLQSLGGHHLPHLDYYNRVPLDRLEPHPEAAATRELAAWGSKRAEAGAVARKPPLVVVAVDGGGIRAAAWTTIVMAQLERDLPTFPYYVRVVTGASGGMVGIASYVASLRPPTERIRHLDLDKREVTLDQLVDRVATDSLGPVARELVFRDFFLPPFLHRTADRGLALERAWEHDTRILEQPFSALEAGETEGWRPSLIVSPVIVEDGRRLLISNLDLGELITVSAEPPSLQALEYFPHIEPRPGTLRLSTAVRMNASFPYVSPAAELPTEPPRHVLDAGYYDEHGVELAGTWIWTHREWLRDNTGGVLLVQVPDTRTRERKRQARKDRRDWWAAGLLGVTAPVETLLTTNGASADYRNDQLLHRLAATLNDSRPDFFATVVFEPEANKAIEELKECRRSGLREFLGGKDAAFHEVALSWRLTRCEVSRLKESIRGDEESQICADRRRFQGWWNVPKPDTEPPLAVSCPPAS